MSPRRLWTVSEPLHVLTYFAPESHDAFTAAGLRGFWRGYFAGRAAPLGPVGPGLVTATFFGFHPAFVSRAIPSVWSIVTPDDAITARQAGIAAALRRILGSELPSSCDDAIAQLRHAVARDAGRGTPAVCGERRARLARTQTSCAVARGDTRARAPG